MNKLTFCNFDNVEFYENKVSGVGCFHFLYVALNSLLEHVQRLAHESSIA